MISDHIKFLKKIVEEEIVSRDGSSNPLDGKFFEISPDASTIKKIKVCAVLNHKQGKNEKKGSYDSIEIKNTTIVKTKKLYDSEYVYQVNIHSDNIYDLIAKDETYKTYYEQLLNLIAVNNSFIGSDGRTIEVECGVSGIIDDKSIIVDGIYQAYCQVKFKDGIYVDETVPRVLGIKINEGGNL